MLKLYRISESQKDYWETWEETAQSSLVHWGSLGTRGSTKTVRSGFLRSATDEIQAEIDQLVAGGFRPMAPEDHAILMIEYSVEGMGSAIDVDKRHRLEQRMNETLGWSGLGACDGGSIGGGTMEVCCFVVDFNLARQLIEDDLAETEFADYSRIYDEGAG
jgi:hypothetical protein